MEARQCGLWIGWNRYVFKMDIDYIVLNIIVSLNWHLLVACFKCVVILITEICSGSKQHQIGLEKYSIKKKI